MAKFLNRCLQVLDRLYKFDAQGQHSTDRMDLGAPIQLVHDLSREAELSGVGHFGGWSLVRSDVAHVGASTESQHINVYEALIAHADFAGIQAENEIDAWLMDIAVRQTNAFVTEVMIGFAYPAMPPETGTTNLFPLFYATEDTLLMANYSGAGFTRVMMQDPTVAFPPKLNGLPRYIPHQENRITVRTVSSGAVTISTQLLLWVGKRGTTPPGMR